LTIISGSTGEVPNVSPNVCFCSSGGVEG